MTEFTPYTSLLGGILIGLSALIMMFANGRIAGVSGIIARILPPKPIKSRLGEGVLFVVGLMITPTMYELYIGASVTQSMTDSVPLLIAAGLLVGYGSVIGSGCTSGHGVCGVSRLSQRSIVATITFMTTGFISVYILRHVMGV